MKLRQDLFHDDPETKQVARDRLQPYIDQIMSTTFGPDLILPRECNNSFCLDAPPQQLRDAHHEDLSPQIKGKVIEIRPSGQYISPKTLIDHSLNTWQKHAFIDKCMQSRPDVFFPLSDARIHMSAYT